MSNAFTRANMPGRLPANALVRGDDYNRLLDALGALGRAAEQQADAALRRAIIVCNVAKVRPAAGVNRAANVSYDLQPIGQATEAIIRHVRPDHGRPVEHDAEVTIRTASVGDPALVIRLPGPQGQPMRQIVFIREAIQTSPCA